MDPFSHLLLGYLLGFGLWGPGGLPYVIAAAIAGALPDLDVALYPLSRRFPLLRHRGVSHSILGVTVIAVIGSFVIPPAMAWSLGPAFGGGSLLEYFAALEIGGLSHVFLDSLDHWSVPIFAPFSEVEYHFDVDRIVNVGSMAFTVIAYVTLIYERGRFPVAVWSDTTWVFLGAVLFYFAVRIVGRWRAGVVQRREGFSSVIPQGNPFVFVFFGEDRTPEQLRLRTARYHLLRGFVTDRRAVEMPLHPPVEPSTKSEQAALARSYPIALSASWMLNETHRFAEVRPMPGHFDVFWYSLEVSFWGRSAGVLAQVDTSTGKVISRNQWRSPAAPFS
ncbi:MAG: metal-dependent hydrolase [Thermoplasmata archaeon]